MHTLHLRNFFALVCLLLLTASVAAAAPANHSALMADGAYRKAFGAYAAAEQEAMKRLDARDFAASGKPCMRKWRNRPGWKYPLAHQKPKHGAMPMDRDATD